MSVTTHATRRRKTLAGYAVLLIALLALGGAYAVLTAQHGTAASGDPSLAVKKGRALYLQGCSSCHGLAAQGGSKAPSLIGVGAAAVDFQVGTGRMPLAQEAAQAKPKPPKYTQEQIDQLAAYIASLAPGPAVPASDQLNYKDADMAAGGNLFRTNCSACHNFVGQGGALTGGKVAPSLTGTSAKHLYEAMLTGPGNMPVFSDTQLSPQEKLEIINYVKHVAAQADPGGNGIGRVGPVTEGIVIWVVGIGALIGVAVWIGARHKA
jgi:ubiquinol-cytochrome c reductase cytochrome c subunit